MNHFAPETLVKLCFSANVTHFYLSKQSRCHIQIVVTQEVVFGQGKPTWSLSCNQTPWGYCWCKNQLEKHLSKWVLLIFDIWPMWRSLLERLFGIIKTPTIIIESLLQRKLRRINPNVQVIKKWLLSPSWSSPTTTERGTVIHCEYHPKRVTKNCRGTVIRQLWYPGSLVGGKEMRWFAGWFHGNELKNKQIMGIDHYSQKI